MKSTKKIISSILIGTLIWGGFNTGLENEANAESNKDILNQTINLEQSANEYKVIVSKTTVRKSPSTKSYKLGTLRRGDIVNVYNISNGWAKINYKEKIGYVKLSDLEKIKVEESIKTGSITVKYLDSLTKEEILSADYLENLELKTYSYTAKDIDGYTLDGDKTQSITITESNPNKIIQFLYNKKEETNEPSTEYFANKGIFSWKNTQCAKSMREDTYYWIDKLQLNEIYQANIFRLSSSETKEFVTDLKVNKKVSVYDLTGDASWYNKPEEFIKRIDRVKNYNDTVGSESKVKGVVFDVEPWVLGDGNWSQEEYANTIKKAYEHAKIVGVEMIMVIPFWLEQVNSEVIIENSDKTIVMNYNIKAPVKFIKEEIELAKKYNKKISTAAETKKIDADYGVDTSTTYYYVGVDRLKQDWTDIYNTYEYDKLEFTLHDFNSVKEFIK